MRTAGQRQVLGPALRRFWAVAVLAAVVCGGLTTWLVQQVSTTTYSASGTFVVPTVSAPGGTATLQTTSPFDAERLARTYTVVLSDDQRLLDALAERAGLAPEDVYGAVDAVNVPSSSAIRVTFTADEAQQVEAFFAALNDTFVAAESPTPNLPARSLQALQLPTAVTPAPGLDAVAPVLGVIVGVVLGGAGAVLLERLDARLRSAGELREMTEWPVLDVSGGDPGARMETVVLRALAEPATRVVTVTTVPGVPGESVHGMATRLHQATTELHRRGRLGADRLPVSWQAVGALATDGEAERAVQDGDATVVLAPRKARLRALDAGLGSLEPLGAREVLLVLVDRPKRSRERTDGKPAKTSPAKTSPAKTSPATTEPAARPAEIEPPAGPAKTEPPARPATAKTAPAAAGEVDADASIGRPV